MLCIILYTYQSDYNYISHLPPFTDFLWHGRSEETTLQVTCKFIYAIILSVRNDYPALKLCLNYPIFPQNLLCPKDTISCKIIGLTTHHDQSSYQMWKLYQGPTDSIELWSQSLAMFKMLQTNGIIGVAFTWWKSWNDIHGTPTKGMKMSG